MAADYGCSGNDALETGVHHWERYHDIDYELELARAPAANLIMLQTIVLPTPKVSPNLIRCRPRLADVYRAAAEVGESRQTCNDAND